MNREIKFRGWDTGINKMWSEIEMGRDELTINPDGRGFVNVNNITRLSQYYTHIIPLQYTGLRDKNGKEIYEGDIVEFKTNYTNKKGGWLNGVVIWDSERYGWALNAENTIYDIYDETEGFEYMVKHIGNIYENPELLTNN